MSSAPAAVLFVTRSTADGETARRAIAGARAEVTVLDDPTRLDELLVARSWSLVYLCASGPTESFEAALDLLTLRAPATPVALIVADRCEPYFPLFQRRSNVLHLMAQDHPVTAIELMVTTRKILSRDIFGVEKYVVWGSAPWRRTVRSSQELSECRDWIEQIMAQLGVRGRLAGRVVLAADELLSNALFHAPRSVDGGSRHGHLDRSSVVQMADGEEASLEVAHDGNVIAIAVSDAFGALTRDGVAAFLNRCALRTPETAGGERGGLGLYTVFRTASSLVVNLSAGKRTEIVALFRLGATMREYRSRAPSFHIFQVVES